LCLGKIGILGANMDMSMISPPCRLVLFNTIAQQFDSRLGKLDSCFSWSRFKSNFVADATPCQFRDNIDIIAHLVYTALPDELKLEQSNKEKSISSMYKEDMKQHQRYQSSPSSLISSKLLSVVIQ